MRLSTDPQTNFNAPKGWAQRAPTPSVSDEVADYPLAVKAKRAMPVSDWNIPETSSV